MTAKPRRVDDPITLKRIREALVSGDPALRSEAVDALAMIGDLAGLLRAAGSVDPYVRVRAVRSLTDVPGLRARAAIVQAAFGEMREVREAAASALAARRGTVAQVLLVHLACDKDSTVRYRALVGLARLDGAMARAALERTARNDRERWLRATAAELLRQPHGRPIRTDDGSSRN